MMQSFWLYSRYKFSVDSLREQVSREAKLILDNDMEYRNQNPIRQNYTASSIKKIEESDTSKFKKGWVCHLYVTPLEQLPALKKFMLKGLSEDLLEDSIKSLQFFVESAPSEKVLYDAVRIYGTNERYPINIAKLRSDFNSAGLEDVRIDTITESQIRWVSESSNIGTLYNPSVSIVYPYNPLTRQSIKAIIGIPTSTVIKRMTYTLALAIFVSLMLIACLVIQIITIKKMDMVSRLRQDFISTMLHELKRPLYTLKMCMSFLGNQKNIQNNERLQPILVKSKDEIDNLSSYFSKLRELSFEEMSAIPVNIKLIKLKEIIAGAIEKVHKPENKHVNIITSCPDDCLLHGDKIYLSDMFINLMENSFKYSDTEVTVEIECIENDNQIVIRVTDDGWGIPASEIKNIFFRFQRGKRATKDKLPGMGLGLSYVQQIIKAHKGRITVSSILDKGTIFEITLPL